MTITAMRARLRGSPPIELICSDLPAWYRRARLQQELSTLDAAAAEDLLDRVLGRLDDEDALVVLLST